MTTRRCRIAIASAVVVFSANLAGPAWSNEVISDADAQTFVSRVDAQSGQPSGQGASFVSRGRVGGRTGGVYALGLGSTLSLLGSNAILSDASLLDMSLNAGRDSIATGLQVAFGSVAPSNLTSLTSSETGGLFGADPASHFVGELSYSSAVGGGNFKTWIDALWQDGSANCSGSPAPLGVSAVVCDDNGRRSWGIGSKVDYMGFELVGYFHNSESFGLTSRLNHNPLWNDASGNGRERPADGYVVQGTYALNGKTKFGVSYGEGNMEKSGPTGAAANVVGQHLDRQLWTVGVYHDVSSWLRLIAEYNRGELNNQSARKGAGANTISVGTFLYW